MKYIYILELSTLKYPIYLIAIKHFIYIKWFYTKRRLEIGINIIKGYILFKL